MVKVALSMKGKRAISVPIESVHSKTDFVFAGYEGGKLKIV